MLLGCNGTRTAGYHRRGKQCNAKDSVHSYPLEEDYRLGIGCKARVAK